MSFADIGGFLSSYSIALPLTALIYSYKGVNTRRYKALAFFFGISLLSEILSLYFGAVFKNNLIILNFFALAEYIFWCYFFYQLLNYLFLQALIVVLSIPLIYFWFHHAFYETLWELNSFFAICEASVILILSAFYLLILSKNSSRPIQEVPEFWFAAGALIYFTNSIIALGVSWYVKEAQPSDLTKTFNANFFNFYYIFNILANIIYSKGFLCLPTKKI